MNTVPLKSVSNWISGKFVGIENHTRPTTLPRATSSIFNAVSSGLSAAIAGSYVPMLIAERVL